MCSRSGVKIVDLMRDAGLIPESQRLADPLLATKPDNADPRVTRRNGSAAWYAGALYMGEYWHRTA